MNSYQISRILNHDPKCKQIFIGVYARDELPSIYKLPCAFVINTDKRSEPGRHWLAFYFDENGKGEFFDPIGMHPRFYNLEKYLDNNTSISGWTYNERRIQGFFSNYCGLYCILFIYFKSRQYTLRKFLSYFTDNFDKNDEKIAKYVKIKM